ncbi:MAG: nuclear transport factor 2 family protein [Desulfuromonadales bacterium]|nr:nuclear transport factor 2 family protein [Desulfuromonadales bacterium]
MTTVEDRLRVIEERQALQDVLTAYCTAVDSLSDIDGLLDCFTEDAVFDLSGIHLPRFEGQAQIRKFFHQVFADMSHHAHYNTNFAVDELSADQASCRAYVTGMGAAKDGRSVLVYVQYHLRFARTPSGWKIKSFSESPLMPLPPEVTGIHARG